MGLLLTWLALGLFALVIFWGINVPVARRTPMVVWLVALIAVMNLLAQTALFRAGHALRSSGISVAEAAATPGLDLHRVLTQCAIIPGSLRYAPVMDWYRLATSSVLHFGWVPLFINLWFVVLFGHVLEGLIGRVRFVVIAAAGLLLPAALDGFLPAGFHLRGYFTGGASGLVYALMGASLVRFPRAKCYVALNTDSQFWVVVLLVLGPVSIVANAAGLILTETILLTGFCIVFYLIQPVCKNILLPLWCAAAFKLFLDVAILWPLTATTVSTSAWRIGGGLMTGVILAAVLCGVRGCAEVWGDESAPKKSRWKRRESVADLEARAGDDAQAAKRFLAQRVFVGDAARVLDFYPRVIMAKFPELVLPVNEQIALARMLHFKGRDVEAAHAYQNLLTQYTLDENHWDVWLSAAELLYKVDPQEMAQVRMYLETFLQGPEILMRDRIAAEQLLQKLSDDGDGNEDEAQVKKDERDGVDEPATAPMPVVPAEEGVAWMTRLTPRSFPVLDGMPAGPPRRSSPPVKDVLSPEEIARSYWKPLPLESGGKLDGERLLEIRTKGAKSAPPEQSSGQYGAPGGARTTQTARRGRGRLANIQAIKQDFRPLPSSGFVANSDAETADLRDPGHQPKYGPADAVAPGAERPKIRLARERNESPK